MKITFTKAGLALGFVAALGVTGFAQTPSPQTGGQPERQTIEREGRRRHRIGDHRVSVLRDFNRAGLTLTDAQQQQLRQIEERAAQGSEAQRAELRGIFERRTQDGALTAEQAARVQALRNELREAGRRTRAEALAVLTSEQRALLEQNRQQHRQRHEARRERGGHRMRGFDELNLSDAQRQQITAIRERYTADIQAQREELRRFMEERQQGANSSDAQVRAQRLEQLNEPIQRMRAEILAVLTPEQRTQLEQRRAEHRARRGHRGERFRGQRQGQTPPMPGSTQP